MTTDFDSSFKVFRGNANYFAYLFEVILEAHKHRGNRSRRTILISGASCYQNGNHNCSYSHIHVLTSPDGGQGKNQKRCPHGTRTSPQHQLLRKCRCVQISQVSMPYSTCRTSEKINFKSRSNERIPSLTPTN